MEVANAQIESLETALSESTASVNSVQQTMAPEDVAAFKFKQYSGYFEQAVDTLTARQAKRVLKNLVLYPLRTTELKFTSVEEKSVFAIGDDLLVSKYMMMLYASTQKIDEAQQELKKEESKLQGDKENV